MTSSSMIDSNDRRIYRGLTLTKEAVPSREDQRSRLDLMPPPPPWRTFGLSVDKWLEGIEEESAHPEQVDVDERALGFVTKPKMVELVNAALCLRRPLLIEGTPGAGKTSLAYAVAQELGLPGPYRWSIVSRTRFQEGLYSYDAIGRLQETSLMRQRKGETGEIEPPDLGDFLRLGPMGMAFYRSKPRRPAVLLIDEIDKSDIDMPNDLLHIFEEGYFEIPELKRLNKDRIEVLPYQDQRDMSDQRVPILNGIVQCQEFPLVFMTSNEAREFPPAFLRRCLRLPMQQPKTEEELYEVLQFRFGNDQLQSLEKPARDIINLFLDRINQGKARLATDQLLNAVHLLLNGTDLTDDQRKVLLDSVFKSL